MGWSSRFYGLQRKLQVLSLGLSPSGSKKPAASSADCYFRKAHAKRSDLARFSMALDYGIDLKTKTYLPTFKHPQSTWCELAVGCSRMRPPNKNAEGSDAVPPAAGVFCPACATPAGPGQRFCGNCGTKLAHTTAACGAEY